MNGKRQAVRIYSKRTKQTTEHEEGFVSDLAEHKREGSAAAPREVNVRQTPAFDTGLV
jgi:hypothetical protein